MLISLKIYAWLNDVDVICLSIQSEKSLYQFFDDDRVNKVAKDAMDKAVTEYHDSYDKFPGDSMCISCYEQCINPPYVRQGALLLPVNTKVNH